MNKESIISLDLMGGDEHPEARLKALETVASKYSNVTFRTFVSKSYLETINPSVNNRFQNIDFFECERSVSMSDTAYSALREKRSSSLSQAIQDVSNQNSDICLTSEFIDPADLLNCSMASWVFLFLLR